MGVGEPIIVPDVLRTIALHAPEVAGSLGLVVDVRRDYGASGSALQTTGTIAGGSDVLTIAEVGDFQDGQGIAVAGAGAGGALLVTSILSGGGTTTLVLAVTAGSSVAGAAVQHDDTAAIQGAIASASGPVTLPVGTYTISSRLLVGSGSHIIIHGTIYLQDDTNDSVMVIPQNATNVLIELYGVIDGNKAANANPVYGVSGNANGGIVTPFLNNAGGQNVSRVSILGHGRGVIQNCFNWGFNGSGVTDGLVEGVSFVGCGNSAQWAFGSTRCSFRGCRASATSDSGLAFYAGASYCSAVDCRSHGSSPGSGIAVFNDANGPDPCHDIQIIGGEFWGNSGIGVSVSSGQSTPVDNYDVIVVGAQAYGNDIENGGGQGGIVFGTGATRCLAIGCQSHHNGNGANGAYGIGLTGDASYCVVQGCQAWNNGQGGTAGYGVWADDTATNCVIADNQIWDDQATKTQVFGIAGLGGASMVVRGNWLGPSIGTPGLQLPATLGAGTVLEGNSGPNGLNPHGPLAAYGTQPAVPAASTPLINETGMSCDVYVAGGAAVSVKITSGGQTSEPLGSVGPYRLQPGDSIDLGAYTTAPSWTWIAR